ncbi:MAG: transglutaminase domain-containing protein, partial [Lacisediminihabitans sp.]
MKSARLSPGFIAVNTAMMWLTTAIASAALWPIYRSDQIVLLIVVITVAASVVAILGAVFRWPGYVMVLATLGLYLAFGVPLAVPSDALYGILPTPDGLVSLLTGTALGWKQLLTITLPVGGYQSLLVPAFVLILLSVIIGLSVALRSKRGDLVVLAPAALFIIAIAFGPER